MHEPSVLKNPFTYTPPIRGYLGYAYLLSILFAQENPPWPWLYNQYIAIGARRDYSRFEQIATDWMGVYEGAMQYYFMELPVEQVADPDQGLQAILSLLRRGYYVYGEFNERYVPHTSSYRRWDFRHCYCLYGYSREQHLLFSAAYSDARRYEELEIPFSDYLRALAESGREKITIDFYRCNPAFVPVFDPESCAFRIREYLESKPEKPFILCEYMHDMGNSLGGMESYVKLAEEYPQYQGGFIWDYMDQAIWHTDVMGRKVLGYGGDFGERTTDYNFSGNGIVYADGAEKPAMQDVRYWYASPADRAAQDAANAAAAAQADRTLAEAWQSRRAYPLVVTQGDGNLGVKGKNFEMLFSIAGAGPASLKVNGTEWLWRAPRPAFWRASTDNDRGCGFPLRAAAWMAADCNI